MSAPGQPMDPERLADLRRFVATSTTPAGSWIAAANELDIFADLLADRDRLADLLECARVVTRADECDLDCDEACPCIYCRSAKRLDAHFDGKADASLSKIHEYARDASLLRLAVYQLESERDGARSIAQEWRSRGWGDWEGKYPFPWETEAKRAAGDSLADGAGGADS